MPAIYARHCHSGFVFISSEQKHMRIKMTGNFDFCILGEGLQTTGE